MSICPSRSIRVLRLGGDDLTITRADEQGRFRAVQRPGTVIYAAAVDRTTGEARELYASTRGGEEHQGGRVSGRHGLRPPRRCRRKTSGEAIG